MDEVLKLFGVITAVGLAGTVVYTVLAITQTVVRRVTRRAEPAPDELAWLRDRAEQVEILEQRLTELENRVDFAERVLTAPERDAGAVGTGTDA